ncbi:glycine dehydrogenase (aminomethyl-transferring) [Ammoniphilus oxalaticus]|uniref:Probable glycine dehydrogenase (decarboxylating) subunit 1 n=1 Tax=Ammoniphilus oxalaticus TaxID=66863 RepID=A0A419SML7_9BACL|nr:aminomethyl-transferring glycine dehydrogenase subunit GcvPA [Ammoniphilus oxalaticus]RKD25534.1 glycine dehydrogenase (aminomethyl-transferring) [Ammoniphilus oxalaticus]
MARYRYLPMTSEDKQEMLSFLGIEDVYELFSDIPEAIRFKGKLNIQKELSEVDTVQYFSKLAGKNVNSSNHAYFLGAGIYDHYIPSTVDHVISRSEFYTAYTPYQPEISQGELQAIFEFQTMICELTGMEVANSSMYDGPTALAEAGNLAVGGKSGKKVLVSKAVHPEARQILKVNARGQGYEVVEIDLVDGMTDLQALETAVDEQTAAVIVQYPNFLGSIEDLAAIEKIAHRHNGMLVVSSNPLALGMLQPPGAFGADIVVGDVQPLGIPMQLGGPTCGYFAVRQKLMRRIPGRIVGQTTDQDGKRGFVLTLQAREQHIRREKATSNICSNQALMALASSVAMTALGKRGVQEMALLNVQKTQYAKQAIAQLDGYQIPFSAPIFNEFVVKVPGKVGDLNRALLKRQIVGGYDLGRDYPELAGHLLVAVTEIRTKEQIDSFVQGLEGFARG